MTTPMDETRLKEIERLKTDPDAKSIPLRLAIRDLITAYRALEKKRKAWKSMHDKQSDRVDKLMQENARLLKALKRSKGALENQAWKLENFHKFCVEEQHAFVENGPMHIHAAIKDIECDLKGGGE